MLAGGDEFFFLSCIVDDLEHNRIITIIQYTFCNINPISSNTVLMSVMKTPPYENYNKKEL